MDSKTQITAVLSSAILTLLVASTLLTRNVCALKCWNCQSSIDPKCADPFDNTTLPIVDCDAMLRTDGSDNRQLICRKIRQKVNGEWRTSRSCGYLDDDFYEGKCIVQRSSDIFMEICSCKGKEGCNGAMNLVLTSGSFLTLALSIVLSTIYISKYISS